MSIKDIPLSDIRDDGDTQPRAELNEGIVDLYAEDVEKLPPGKAVFDGEHYWLYEGFHRLAAHKQAEATTMALEVIEGTLEEARWLAAGSNKEHSISGLRRTNADKRSAIRMAMQAKPKMSDNQIAAHVGVSHTTCASVRETLSCQVGKIEKREVTRGGSTYTMSTGNIGSSNPPASSPSDSKLIPEIRAKGLSPRFLPRLEALSDLQQWAFLARFNEGKSAEQALAEVLEQVKPAANVTPPPPAPASHQHCSCYFTLKEENDRLRKSQKPPAKPKASANGTHVRCPVFDAIAKVTASDPKVSGSHIAKVRNKLLQGEPPYTAEEVYRWGELVDVWLKGSPPSLGLLEKSIGQVRATPKKGERLFAGFQAFLDKESK